MKVVVSGGGTMGHINPALAIIEEIKNNSPNSQIYYFGKKNSAEENATKNKGIEFYPIDIQGINRKNIFKNIKTLSMYFKSKKKVNRELLEIDPDIVIGTGGYVSSVVLAASKKRRIPFVIHEQNSVPGLTNTYFSKHAKKVFISFEESKKYFKTRKCLLTGNPSNTVVDKKQSYIKYPFGYKRVLIVGGSQGAERLNQVFLESYQKFKNEKVFIVFVTGKKYYENTKKINQKNVYVCAYIKDLINVMREMDLIVSRAGATTIFEILSIKKPAILIPSPNVTGNHQEKNANYLYEHEACIKIEEEYLTSESLYFQIKEVLRNPVIKMRMIENQAKLYIPNSSKKIVSEIIDIVKEKQNEF